jgi:hypothetical protein
VIELFSMIFGGLLRLAPELLKLFTARDDRAHEIAMTQIQLEIDKARSEQAIDLVHANAAVAAQTAEMGALVSALQDQFKPTGIRWVDALSATVRPVLTYWWCLVLYTAYKAVTILAALHVGADLAALAAMLVTEFDRQVIGSVFSFWFVDRALRRSV